MRKPNKDKLREVMSYLSSLGASKGGHARAKALTPERRSEIAKLAGLAPKRPRQPTNG